MHLHIEHFAKLSTLDMDFKGLTVLAGVNNTGKSTVGKILYAFFRSLSHIEEQTMEERLNTIQNAFRYSPFSPPSRQELLVLLKGKMSPEEYLVSQLNKIKIRETKLRGKVPQKTKIIDLSLPFWEHQTKDLISEIQESIAKARSTSEDIIKSHLIYRVFHQVFHNQIIPLRSAPGSTKLTLKIQNQPTEIIFSKRTLEFQSTPLSFTSQAILISTPDVLNYLNVWDLEHNPDYANLLEPYVYELAVSLVKDTERTVVEEAENLKNLEQVLPVLDEAIQGQIRKTAGGDYGLQEDGNTEPTKLENLSMGMKSLLLLKRILEKGLLSPKDVLIFDEPEVHLHPSWQLIFAKIIILLQKELSLTVLVTTHSPYFLRALQVYSEQEDISGKTSFYFMRPDGDTGLCTCDDCTNDIQRIFKSLYEPFAELM